MPLAPPTCPRVQELTWSGFAQARQEEVVGKLVQGSGEPGRAGPQMVPVGEVAGAAAAPSPRHPIAATQLAASPLQAQGDFPTHPIT